MQSDLKISMALESPLVGPKAEPGSCDNSLGAVFLNGDLVVEEALSTIWDRAR